MKKLIVLLVTLTGGIVCAQNEENVKMFGCNYYGGNVDPKRICQFNTFMSNKQAEAAVDRIEPAAQLPRCVR